MCTRKNSPLQAKGKGENSMAAGAILILSICTVLGGQGSTAQDCGETIVNTKIVGGEAAAPGSWPWQVSVYQLGNHICGGTLISNQWVLTAAHCINTQQLSEWTLYFGRETQSGTNVNEENRTVSQITVHPDYNVTLFVNDVALMKLSSPVAFTDYIRPVCLASVTSRFHNSTLCWASGWGKLGKNLSLSDKLREVQIPVIGNKECSCNYQSEATITDEMICAGQKDKGACQGDSGGPLQCKQGSRWVQAGVTSFGVPCALDGFPEVYARVSRFQTWISGQVAGAAVNFVTFNSSGTDQDSSFGCRSAASASVALSVTAILQAFSMATFVSGLSP